MLISETGNTKFPSIGDEDSVNFRPSPNFRLMKKYLKYKIGEESHSPQYHGVAEISETEAMKRKKHEQTEKVHPPLPNRPPLPPPEPLLANFKKEINDDEETPSITINIKKDPTENYEKPNDVEETMCRNFVRNTCNRGASCRYLHKIIHSQLKGVYKFCIDFENKKCTRAECSYAHATVHEKEHFFRTGYLPPNTLSHIKKKTVLPPAKTKETSSELSANYTGTTYPHSTTSVPMYTNASNISMMQNPYEKQWPEMEDKTSPEMAYYSGHPSYPHSTSTGYPNAPPNTPIVQNPYATVISPTKRQWTEMEEPVSQPTHEYVEYAEMAGSKKCRNCDVNEFRFQHNKNKIMKMIKDTDDLNHRVGQITKKNTKLNEVLVLLVEVVTEHCNPGITDETNFDGSAMAEESEESDMLSGDMNYY